METLGKMVLLQRDKSQRWQKGQNTERRNQELQWEGKQRDMLGRSRTEGFELRLLAPSLVFCCMLLLVTVLVRRDMPYYFNIAPNNLF